MPRPAVRQTGEDQGAADGADASDWLAVWVERLDDMDVGELSATIGTWVRQTAPELDRRSLLLKLSAALSLAAVDPVLASAIPSAPPTTDGKSAAASLSGIWHSQYAYFSSGRGKRFIGEHYVVLRQEGNRLIGQSVPAVNGSELRLDLRVDGTVVTGRWAEQTSPTGYYRGAVYHGALQLVLDPLGKSMSGRWIGFDREFNIDSDVWHLKWMVDAAARHARRTYHMKVREVAAQGQASI